jgi:topoisomerase-4 subunit A
VLLNIDEVIRIIRAADEPKPALIERFALSERQADDILEIRLRQLARLEAIRIEQELKELRVEAAKLDEILKSPAILKRTMIKEIEADAKAHGDERRTLILEQKRTVVEIKVPDEPVTVVVSLKGWVRALKGHEIEPASLGFKAGDGLYGTFACRSVDNLLVFGTEAGGVGRVYSTPVAQLPSGRGDGQPITSLIDLESGTQPVHYFRRPCAPHAAARRHARLRICSRASATCSRSSAAARASSASRPARSRCHRASQTAISASPASRWPGVCSSFR